MAMTMTYTLPYHGLDFGSTFSRTEDEDEGKLECLRHKPVSLTFFLYKLEVFEGFLVIGLKIQILILKVIFTLFLN